MITLNINATINITDYLIDELYCMYDITVNEFTRIHNYYGVTTIEKLEIFKKNPSFKLLFSLPSENLAYSKPILIKKGSLLPLQRNPINIDHFMNYDERNEREIDEGLELYNGDFLMCDKNSIEDIKTGFFDLYYVEVNTLSIFNTKGECVYFPINSYLLENIDLDLIDNNDLINKYNKSWKLASSEIEYKNIKKLHDTAMSIFIK